MAVSGLPTRCSGHAINIANLALDMIDIVQEVNTNGRKMQVRSSTPRCKGGKKSSCSNADQVTMTCMQVTCETTQKVNMHRERNSTIQCPGARLSKFLKSFRARKAVSKTPTRLFC